MSNAAAGLGAFGFWIFIAAIVVSGIWYDSRRKETQQETLRRVVESGKTIDPVVLDRIMGGKEGKSLERDLRVAALIVLFAAPGMAVLAFFLGQIAAEARAALLGTAGLVAFVGFGLMVAARLVERRYSDLQD
jgi:small-conductance mechanosensitive channel